MSDLPITGSMEAVDRHGLRSTQIEDAEQTVFSVQTDAHDIYARFWRERGQGGVRF